MVSEEFLMASPQAKYGLIVSQSVIEHFQVNPVSKAFWITFDDYTLKDPRKCIYHHDRTRDTIWRGYFLIGKLKHPPKIEATLEETARDCYRDNPPINHSLSIGLKIDGKNIEFKPANEKLSWKIKSKFRNPKDEMQFSMDIDFDSRILATGHPNEPKISSEVKNKSLTELTEKLRKYAENRLKIYMSEKQV